MKNHQKSGKPLFYQYQMAIEPQKKLKRLFNIDLYQPCRMDDIVPVEGIIGTVADLIKEGKVRTIGVSEITADQLRKASSIHNISALEIRYSLADHQIEDELLPVAMDLGIVLWPLPIRLKAY